MMLVVNLKKKGNTYNLNTSQREWGSTFFHDSITGIIRGIHFSESFRIHFMKMKNYKISWSKFKLLS